MQGEESSPRIGLTVVSNDFWLVSCAGSLVMGVQGQQEICRVVLVLPLSAMIAVSLLGAFGGEVAPSGLLLHY
jgi:hypothetical protein